MIDPHYPDTHVYGMYKQCYHIYVASWGDNDSPSTKRLSWKIAMLLALTRPSRSADLSQLSLLGKQHKPDGVSFAPSGLAKQSRQGKPITEFFFPSFPHDSGLCPVVTLKAYEDRTAPLRNGEQKLFLAVIKPYKAVTSSTIARWLGGSYFSFYCPFCRRGIMLSNYKPENYNE